MPGSDQLPNDRFGFSCYTLVFPASAEIRKKVDAIEKASGMTRAKIPAHITVKGTFHEIGDLGMVKTVARHVISSTERFRISFDGGRVVSRGSSAMLDVPTSEEMQRLHDELVAAFRPLATTVYPDDPYRTHMTLYQGASEDGIEAVATLVEKTEFKPGFEATAVDLWGRQGPAYGGRWERIETFPLR